MSKRIALFAIALTLCVVVASPAQELIKDLAGQDSDRVLRFLSGNPSLTIEPSISISPGAEPPFVLNEETAALASEVDEKEAQEKEKETQQKLDEIHVQLAKLI